MKKKKERVCREAWEVKRHLLELMDAEDAAGIAAVRTHFLTEARRDSSIAFGQFRFLDPFVAMEGGDRLFRGSDQVFLVYFFIFSLFAAFTDDLHNGSFFNKLTKPRFKKKDEQTL